MFSNFRAHLRVSSFILLGSLIVLGCTQKREDQFAQGMGGNNLQRITTYDGELFPICTGEALSEPVASSAREFIVGTDMESMRVLPLVSYQAPLAHLLPKELPFYGHSHNCDKYKVLYKLTDKYLKVFKVGKKEDIPFHERTYADKLDEGLLAVPLLGYPVEHISVEKRRNQDNEPTHEWIEVRVEQKSQATDYRFQKNRYVEFEALQKTDLFPLSFFALDDSSQEWTFSTGLMELAGEGEHVEGLVDAADMDGNIATRIRFCRLGENQLALVNTTVDPARKKIELRKTKLKSSKTLESCTRYSQVLMIPVQAVEFETIREGGEESLREKLTPKKPWQKRPWLKLDFNSLRSVFGVGNVERVEVTANGLSFTINYHGENRGRVRYNLMRREVNHRLIGAYAYKKDLDSFYPVKRPVPRESQWTDDYGHPEDREWIIPRFDLKRHNNVIKYRFVEQSLLEGTRPVEVAFAAANWALEQAGTPLRVELEKDASGNYLTTAIGDTRHNWVYMTSTVSGSGYLGLAQVITDPVSGEALHAGFRVDKTGVISELRRSIYDYVLGELNLVADEHIRGLFQISSIPSLNTASTGESSVTSWNPKSHKLLQMLPSEMLGLNAFPVYYGSLESPRQEVLFEPNANANSNNSDWLSRHLEKQQNSAVRNKGIGLHTINFACDHGAHAQGHGVFSKLKTPTSLGCRQFVKHIGELKSEGVNPRELRQKFDVNLLQSCMDAMVEEQMIVVSIHELLHTLSLGHNFEGSYDSDNYFKVAELLPLKNDRLLGPLVQRLDGLDEDRFYASSSSIMEYQRWTDHMLNLPGKADIQMLRYIYGSQIRASDGSLVDKPKDGTIGQSSISVTDHVESKDKKLMPMYSCNERDRSADVFCSPFDLGSTPLEVVQNYIDAYKVSLAKAGLYYVQGQPVPAELVPLIRFSHSLFPLRRIYDQWRLRLLRATGDNNRYLTEFMGMDEAAYFQVLNSLGASYEVYLKVRAGEIPESKLSGFQLWFNAGQRVKDFFAKELIFMDNHYCMVESKNDGDLNIVELSLIREAVEPRERQYARSCESAPIQAWIDRKGLNLVKTTNERFDIGQELYTGRYDIGSKSHGDGTYDFVGTYMDRLNGMLLATLPRAVGPQFVEKDFHPNMMQEPDFSRTLVKKFFDRVRLGVQLPDPRKANNTLYFANFGIENDLLSRFAYLINTSSSAPGQSWTSLYKNKSFDVLLAPTMMYEDKGISRLEIGAGQSIVVPSLSSSMALLLVEDFHRLENNQQFVSAPGTSLRMALNSEEMKSIKEKVVAPLPRLANFIPTSSNQSPTVPKVSLLSEWIRNYARESGDLKKSPQLALAVYNLFDINEFLATSKETSESNNVMISLLEVIAKLSVQKTENTVLTTQPIGNPEETLTAFLNAQQHKEEEILDQETLNYFSQESTLARLEVYQTQQEAMDRRLKLIPGELHRHKELIFSVLLSLSNAGQPFPRPTMVDSMSDR